MDCVGAVKPLVLAALPLDQVARVELCSVTALAKDVRCGDVESAFLMLLKPANPAATMEVDTDIVGTNGEDGSVQNEPTRWDQFCNKYADVFEPLGFPAKLEIDHDLELLPGATPQYCCQYCVSAAESAEVHY